MDFHQLCTAFPPISEDELKALAADIKANGLKHPITVLGGQILDGRNRFKACQLAGVEPRFQEFDGDDPVAFVRSENLKRRHLTSGQRAAIAVELETFHQLKDEAQKRQIELGKTGGRGRKKNLPEIVPEGLDEDPDAFRKNASRIHETREKIATAYDTNARYVNQAEKLQKQHPDLHQQVKRGEITLPTATRQARKRNHGQKLQTREKAIARATPPDMSDRKWTPPQVQMGDVWKLGPHRLHCGDSIHWRPGERAKMAFADPPYNSGVADWDRGFEWRHDWLQDAADYVFITPGTAQLPQFLGVTAMNYRWQYTYWVSNAVSRCNDWGMSNVIAPLLFSELRTLRLQGCRDFEKGAVSTGRTKDSKHPGRKPLGLLVWLMEMTTKPGDLIIDPFLGSGTTLFAAQGAQRVCHGMEINPHFCAEILARWYALTGTAPEKETMAIAQ